MTRTRLKKVKCSKCGHVSTQMIVLSVNIVIGDEERCEALLNHKQKCPQCGYTAFDITEPEWSPDADFLRIMETGEGDGDLDWLTDDECLKLLESDVEREMEEYDLFIKDENGEYVVSDDGEKAIKFGACNTKWEIQKELMQDVFGRDWESPADKYPDVFFD